MSDAGDAGMFSHKCYICYSYVNAFRLVKNETWRKERGIEPICSYHKMVFITSCISLDEGADLFNCQIILNE